MPFAKQQIRVMVLSANDKTAAQLTEILPAETYVLAAQTGSCNEARRKLVDEPFNILVVNTPLPDEFGLQFATEVSAKYPLGVLLLVRAEQYEQAAYKAESFGVLCVAKPCSKQSVYQAITLLTATAQRLQRAEEKVMTLQEKMEEIRLINRAKWLLVERLQMTEPEAHRYIEKQAMDTCRKKAIIAEGIIRAYE